MDIVRPIMSLLALLAVLASARVPAMAADPGGAGGAPQAIAGLRLGQHVTEVRQLLEAQDLDGATTIWRQEYLRRIGVKVASGFDGGYVDVGNCRDAGRILRLKLKYADDTPEQFNRLLRELERRHGRGEWRGDPFGTLKAWKWGFTDAHGDSISLILQFATGDDESETPGNSIRLANRSAMERERQCGLARRREAGSGQRPATPDSPGLEQLLPR